MNTHLAMVLLLLVVGLGLLGLARADSPRPYPGHRAVSADGSTYVLVRPGAPCTLIIVKRAEGKEPLTPFPPSGWLPYHDVPRLAPEAGDEVLATASCRAPAYAVCLDEGRGALLIERWWPRGTKPTVRAFDAEAHTRWTRNLEDLFDAKALAAFPRSMAQVHWLKGFWFDRSDEALVLVSAIGVSRVVAFEDGAVSSLKAQTIRSVLDRGTSADQRLLLEAALESGVKLGEPWPSRVVDDEIALRVDLLRAVSGDPEAQSRFRTGLLSKDGASPLVVRQADRLLEPQAAAEVLSHALSGRDVARRRAAETAWRRLAANHPELLSAAIESPDACETTRLRLIGFAAHLDADAARVVVPTLLMLEGSDAGALREAALVALARIGDERARTPLVGVVRTGHPDGAVDAAVQYLSERGNRSDIPILIRALERAQSDRQPHRVQSTHAALVHLAGADPGTDPAAWRSWWEANKDR